MKALDANGKTYEKDGALWLRTTDYGDDKDRVVRKSDGSYTYFVPDVAYHVTKWQRGFRKVINVQGTDHHSTVTRVRAGLQALGPRHSRRAIPDYVLHSLVKVMRGGEEVKISKRAGSYVTVRDLIDWVGRDAVRFFLVSRKADSEFVFDIDLALEKTRREPGVLRAVRACARVQRVRAGGGDCLRARRREPRAADQRDGKLALARAAGGVSRRCSPRRRASSRRTPWPSTCANSPREFHSYYNAERILVEDEALRAARLALCAAVRQTLANGLSLHRRQRAGEDVRWLPKTEKNSRHAQASAGGFLLGMFVGLVLGLAVSLAIAFYLNKTPVPFLTAKPKQSEKKPPRARRRRSPACRRAP